MTGHDLDDDLAAFREGVAKLLNEQWQVPGFGALCDRLYGFAVKHDIKLTPDYRDLAEQARRLHPGDKPRRFSRVIQDFQTANDHRRPAPPPYERSLRR